MVADIVYTSNNYGDFILLYDSTPVLLSMLRQYTCATFYASTVHMCYFLDYLSHDYTIYMCIFKS